MRRRVCSGIFVAVVFVTARPAVLEAQQGSGPAALTLAPPREAVPIAEVPAPPQTLPPTRAPEPTIEREPTSDHAPSEREPTDATEPEHVELSFGLVPTFGLTGGGLGGLGGLAGLAGGQGLGVVPIAGDVAFPLGSRALVAVGASASYLEGGSRWLSVHVPISVLVYLERPRASAFVSSVRGLARGGLTQVERDGVTMGWLGAAAAVLGGLTYFFDEALALRAELGVGLDATWVEGTTALDLHLQSSLTLVLRV